MPQDSDQQRQMLATRALCAVLLASLGVLIWFSFHLAAMRIFHPDECRNIFVARWVAVGQPPKAQGTVDLFQFGLSWFARGASRSIEIFTSCRSVMLEIFWLNIILLTLATGQKLLSLRGLMVLLGAATLAPLWTYGFEIRQDNLLLTGILLIWCSIRVRPPGLQGYFITGALLVALQCVTFKAFIFTVPISLVLLRFRRDGQSVARAKLCAAYVAGALLMLATILTMRKFAAPEVLDFQRINWSAQATIESARPGIGSLLSPLFRNTPFLLAMPAAACVASIAALFRRGAPVFSWESTVPELLLLAAGFVACVTFPAPANLVYIAPCAFLVAVRYLTSELPNFERGSRFLPIAATLMLFAHLIPFSAATLRQLEHSNARQEGLMRLAENLTDPVVDPVFDPAGLVATRRFSADESSRLPLGELLAAHPAAVLLPSFATNGMAGTDRKFLNEHYVALADDLWILGKTLSFGGGVFEVIHPGRYRISTVEGSDLAGTYPEGFKGLATPEANGTIIAALDGAPLTGRPIELSKGVHSLQCSSNCQPAVVWIGPRLDRVHRAGPGDPQQLFVNLN